MIDDIVSQLMAKQKQVSKTHRFYCSENNEGSMQFGLILKTIRLYRKMNQTELANLIGIKQSQTSEIENGRYLPTPELIFHIEQQLELSAGCLSRVLGYEPTSFDAATALRKAIEEAVGV